MAEPRSLTRTKKVYCALTQAEYAELTAMRAALGQGIRWFLLLGVRLARRRWDFEQRQQRD